MEKRTDEKILFDGSETIEDIWYNNYDRVEFVKLTEVKRWAMQKHGIMRLV